MVGADRHDPVTTVWVAAVCYLGAAALGLPWVARAAIPAGVAGIVLALM
ncbi:hypothetical protein ACU610_10000 [Geodermatophilus sp. URMC 61]